MYLKYGLYVLPVILVTSLAAWLFLKASGRAGRPNNRTLVLSTIAASVLALLVPAVAGTLLEALSLSIWLSILFSFIICCAVLCAGFILAHFIVGKRQIPDDAGPTILESMISESAASSEEPLPINAEAGVDDGYDQIIVDTVRNTDKIGVEENSNNEEKVKKLLESALDCKIQGKFNEAVAFYREILDLTYDKSFASQIIIETCGILKSIGSIQLIRDILDSSQGNLLDLAIKAEIINNI